RCRADPSVAGNWERSVSSLRTRTWMLVVPARRSCPRCNRRPRARTRSRTPRAGSMARESGRDGAAAALPQAGEQRDRHDRGGAGKDQRAVSVGEVASLTGEADAEADDRVVGDGGGVAELQAVPVVGEVAAGGETGEPG